MLQYDKIIFAEEAVQNGGIGERMASALLKMNFKGQYRHIGASGNGLTHAKIGELRQIFGLDAKALQDAMKEELS